jgi:peptide/nickel transport system substrate-binding protein
VKAADDATLVCTITEDFAPSMVLNLMTSIAASVVDMKTALAHEANGDHANAWLKTSSAGSGAYRLVSWTANEGVTLEAFAGFRMGAPPLKHVVISHVAEAGTQRLALEKGVVDIARDLTPDQLKPLAGNRAVAVRSFAGANTWYIGMNVGDGPLASAKVRTAMKMLVDYDGMVNGFLKDRFLVQETFLPIGFMGAIKYNPFKLDVAGARKLLAEAGFANGFTIRLACRNASPELDIAQSVQQTMGQAGIKVSIVPGEAKQVLGEYRARRHQMTLTSWGPDYFDPHTNADSFAHNDDNSDAARVRPLAWRNRWLIPAVTREMLEAAREPDMRQREAMYARLQKTVTDEGPFILMFQNRFVIGMRSGIRGFSPGITEDLIFYRTVQK